MLLCCLRRDVEVSCHTLRRRLPPLTNNCAAYQRPVSSTLHGPSQLSVLHRRSNGSQHTVTEKGGNIPPWGGMQQLFHPHVTKGGEKGGKLIFSTLTWPKVEKMVESSYFPPWHGGKIPPWGGMHQLFHPHVTKGGEKGGKLLFSTLTWPKVEEMVESS